MIKVKRRMAVVILIVFSLSIVLSFQFIIEEAHHDCAGRNCPICLQIEKAVQYLANIRYTPVMMDLIWIFLLPMTGMICQKACFRNHRTLVTLKVELLN